MLKIGVFGVSASGKSTYSSHLKAIFPNVIFSSASEIIRQERGNINFSEIDEKTLIKNQMALLGGIKKLEKKYSDDSVIVIELHAYFEKKGSFIEIDDFYLSEINMSAVFFIEVSPEEIWRRRKDAQKTRPDNDPEFIELIQKKTRIKLEQFSASHSLRFFTDVNLFKKYLRSICS